MNKIGATGNLTLRFQSFVSSLDWVWPLKVKFCPFYFIIKGIEVARRIRDEERGGKAKLVIIGKINVSSY